MPRHRFEVSTGSGAVRAGVRPRGGSYARARGAAGLGRRAVLIENRRHSRQAETPGQTRRPHRDRHRLLRQEAVKDQGPRPVALPQPHLETGINSRTALSEIVRSGLPSSQTRVFPPGPAISGPPLAQQPFIAPLPDPKRAWAAPADGGDEGRGVPVDAKAAWNGPGHRTRPPALSPRAVAPCAAPGRVGGRCLRAVSQRSAIRPLRSTISCVARSSMSVNAPGNRARPGKRASGSSWRTSRSEA